jgi:hypothetical protein
MRRDVFIAFGKVQALGGGEVDFGGIAMDGVPEDGHQDAGGTDDDEHPAPTNGEHQPGK